MPRIYIAIVLAMLGSHGCLAFSNPGLRGRLSQPGLQYAAEVATELLTEQVKSLDIPDQSGSKNVKVGNVHYVISHIHVHSFRPPKSTIETLPFKWKLSGTSTVLNAKWWYEYKLGPIKIHDSGSLEVTITLDLDASVTLNVDSTGRPQIHSRYCHSHVTHINVDFHGGASWLYNLFHGKVEDAITNLLNDNICSEVKKLINNNAEDQLAKMPILVDVHEQIVLDYRLVHAPNLTTTYIDFPLKAEFYWKNDKQEYPYPPKALPKNHTDSHMLAFWVTDYAFNSLAYTEFKHGTLKYNLTKADLPKNDRYILDTTCESLLKPCVGFFIPKVGQLYPNSSVFLDMVVTAPPVLTITPTGVHGDWVGNIQYFAKYPNSSIHFLFSTNTKVTFKLAISMVNATITARVIKFNMNITLDRSAIGQVSMDKLTIILDFAINRFVIPQLNKLGKEGIDLPKVDVIEYHNPNLSLLKNSIYIGVDLKYVGKT